MHSVHLILFIGASSIWRTYGTIIDFDDESSTPVPTLNLESLQLTLSSKLLLDIHSSRGHTLKGYLGWLPRRSNISYVSCSGEESPSQSICLKYGKDMKVYITQDNADQCEEETKTCHAVSCYRIHWSNHVSGTMDCFLIGDGLWYGGGEVISQQWPMQMDSREWYPAVTGDPGHHPTGNVMENLWLSSEGFLIYVEHRVPLFVSFNESASGKMCFSTSTKSHPYENHEKSAELVYSVCTAMNVKDAYSFSLHRWLKKPVDIPDERLFQYPIWSTWARYKANINQSTVISYAREVESEGFTASQIEIDDKWETCYGDLEFDFEKFPSPKTMVLELAKSKVATTLWVHNFCNTECNCYIFGEERGYWVKDDQEKVMQVTWWNGPGAILDVTNEEAVEWFVEKLKRLQSTYGIESFKFDAGEVLWLDKNYHLFNEDANSIPNIFTKSYAKIAARFGGRVEVRVGHDSQDLPIFVRMWDKFSRWDYVNGLRTLIPTALHFSLMGYHFILPDMIGGNNYESSNDSLPDRELFIRWLEANVFLPAIQFSIAPWDYDEEVVKISKKMIDLHEKYCGYILNVAKQATVTGEPIIRPLWWAAPSDIEALNTDSQFLVGDGILVAPVLEKGKRCRDIYLPEGRWADVQRNKVHEGSIWLYDYEAPLNFLPFFIRQS